MEKTNYYRSSLPGFPLDAVYVGHSYDSVIQKKLHRFKFVHNTVDSVYFETIFRDILEESGTKITKNTLIVYPAISLKDRIFRGPNHAKRLAIIFAKIVESKNIACPFKKTFFAGHQSRRNKTQRKQIQSEYTMQPNIYGKITGKDIILIDDIISTGHTAKTLGTLLKKAGSAKITGFFLASHKV